MTGRSFTQAECEAATEAMSAHLDGEPSPLSVAWLTEHLVDCASCRAWYKGAVELRRHTRLTLLPPIPDLTETILAAAAEDQPVAASWRADRSARITLLARVGLAAVAALELWVSLPVLLFAKDHDVSTHPAHELGSFTTALGIGFLVVALWPRFARGMRPLVGATAALLVITASLDLAWHHTTLSDEAPHLLTAAAFFFMCLLSRADRGDQKRQEQRGRLDDDTSTAIPPETPTQKTAQHGPGKGNHDRATA